MIKSIVPNELKFTYSEIDELKVLSGKDTKKSNLLKQIFFTLKNDEKKILTAVNIVKSYLDDFSYFTPVFKHNKNFNINLVIR